MIKYVYDMFIDVVRGECVCWGEAEVGFYLDSTAKCFHFLCILLLIHLLITVYRLSAITVSRTVKAFSTTNSIKGSL